MAMLHLNDHFHLFGSIGELSIIVHVKFCWSFFLNNFEIFGPYGETLFCLKLPQHFCVPDTAKQRFH